MKATAPDAGHLMTMLLSLVSAKKTTENGVFNGYSLLLSLVSVPDDDKFCKELQLQNTRNFDVFAFVDTDKVSYWIYHESLIMLLKLGGMVVHDNTLWEGTVAMPEDLIPEYMKHSRELTVTISME
ncbi:O-methyltransferase [Parasponia andersonii]|uniref:O-methyltransferase n=1 Tax=Parasponia andersonii TaxID=3476 RepID=A0A2P5B016_PARAD|nr:O-methyltransferase [Parasponia andersonii]